MEKEILERETERMCLISLITQATDYLNENVSPDCSPSMLTPNSWINNGNNKKYKNFLNAIAVLMENASDDTKQKVLHELEIV